MTTDLEKQFFNTFGIEPETGIGLVKFKEPHYPRITDRILLELICIVAEYYCFRCDNWVEQYESIDKLKSFILLELIGLIYQKEIKHQVQALFEEW